MPTLDRRRRRRIERCATSSTEKCGRKLKSRQVKSAPGLTKPQKKNFLLLIKKIYHVDKEFLWIFSNIISHPVGFLPIFLRVVVAATAFLMGLWKKLRLFGRPRKVKTSKGWDSFLCTFFSPQDRGEMEERKEQVYCFLSGLKVVCTDWKAPKGREKKGGPR